MSYFRLDDYNQMRKSAIPTNLDTVHSERLKANESYNILKRNYMLRILFTIR
jgi:hypothetical protein